MKFNRESSAVFEKKELFTPPNSVDAEQSVIGAILLSGREAFDKIEGVVNESDFYHLEHQLIFKAARSLANIGKSVDVITVAEALAAEGNLDKIGDISRLGNLCQSTPTAANIKQYASIVHQRAQARQLLKIANEMSSSVIIPGADVEQIISEADAAMVQLIGDGMEESTMIFDAMSDAISDIDERASGNRRSGLQTGIQELDEITQGFEPGNLVILAARPSIGKTALGLAISDYVAQREHSVAFFSLEMAKRDITQRLIALRTGVSVSVQRSGQLSEEHWGLVSQCLRKAEGQSLTLIDRQAIGVPYVRAVARKIKRQHGLALIVIDYIGLMVGEGRTRTEEIGNITRGLKSLAKELQVPIIALSQLNRGVEARVDKRPLLSDLRDSGEIEQDADLVLMLHREELYDNDQKWRGIAELLIRKQRQGKIGDLLLSFDGSTMSFAKCELPNPRHQQLFNQPKVKRGGIDG